MNTRRSANDRMLPPGPHSDMTRQYAWYMLAILTAINFVNYVDRQVIISLGPFIQDDLALSNLQFGLLGTAFMLIHSLATVPFGILSDRWLRHRIIALGVLFWSAATLLSGITTNFASLLGARAAVGIGEAAYAPPANAMLSDAFPARERARILGLFNVGMFIGGAVGLILGGILGEILGWRAAFFLGSLPGFLLAALAWRLREPPGVTLRQRTPIMALRHNRLLLYVLVGGVVTAFSAGALIWWMPQFVIRVREFRPRDAGLYIGVVGVTAGLLGVILGSYLADWLYSRWSWGRMATIGVGLILSSPFVILSLYATNRLVLMSYFFLSIFFMVWYTGPIIAVIHDVVPPDLKATAQALYIFLIHLLGDTFSPAIVGQLADMYSLQTALLLPAVVNTVGGVIFLVGCRGIERELQRNQAFGAAPVLELPRTGTLNR